MSDAPEPVASLTDGHGNTWRLYDRDTDWSIIATDTDGRKHGVGGISDQQISNFAGDLLRAMAAKKARKEQT